MENPVSKKPRQTSDPVSFILPYDLVVDIFRKLPVKSLCRFKCASKSLNATIKSPLFINRYKPQTLMQWQVIFESNLDLFRIYQNGDSIRLKSFEFDGGIFRSKHANGLVCYYDYDARLSLFNPTTNKLIGLPEWGRTFDFGYIPSSNQFKVLAWQESEDHDCYEFQILTLQKEASWKEVKNNLGITSLPDHPAVNVNEYLCWFDKYEERIVLFDLVSEEFGFVGLPKKIDVEEFEYSIFEFEGDLCFVEQPEPETERCSLDIVNLWMLKDRAGDHWVSMLTNVAMPVEGTSLECFYIGNRNAASAVCGSGGEVMVLGADDFRAWVFCWNFLSGELRRVRVDGQQNCINMSVVRKHVENHIDLKQFKRRRAKAKPTLPPSASRQQNSDWPSRI